MRARNFIEENYTRHIDGYVCKETNQLCSTEDVAEHYAKAIVAKSSDFRVMVDAQVSVLSQVKLSLLSIPMELKDYNHVSRMIENLQEYIANCEIFSTNKTAKEYPMSNIETDTVSNKHKYVRLNPSSQYPTIIVFPLTTNHTDFKVFLPISAGFCRFIKGRVECWGESIGLNLPSLADDSEVATHQFFGDSPFE